MNYSFFLSAPVRVQELICSGVSSSELRVTWRESQLPDEELVQYRVEVLMYVQDAMRRVSTTSLTPQYNETVEQNTANINRGLGEEITHVQCSQCWIISFLFFKLDCFRGICSL